jgi:MFS family permease
VPLADRWGSRQLAIFGMAITGLGLVLAGLAQTLTEVYLAYSLGVGVGVGASYVPAVGAVQRWFLRRRGFASGLAVSGIGVGTLLMPPLASLLIAEFGWREAYIALGAFAAVVGIGFSFLIENNPADRSLAPDGGLPTAVKRGAHSGASIGAAVTSGRFVGLYAACLVGSFGLFAPFVHLVPYARDHGVPASSAVCLLGMIGIGSTAGRFVLGGLADRIGRLLSVLAMFLGVALAQGIWAFATDLWSLSALAFIFGVFYGGLVALLPTVVMDDLGARNVSGLIGILYTSVAFGTLVGPSAAGFAFDLSHSYSLPICASMIANVIAAILIAATAHARVPQHEKPSQ